MYKCIETFVSFDGEKFRNGQIIHFEQFYQLLESERKFFRYHSSLQIIKTVEDKIK